MTSFIRILLFLAISIKLSAQPAEQFIRVQVTPEHPNYLYKIGEKIKFNIVVLKNSMPVEGVEISYSISEDMMPAHKSNSLTLKSGGTNIEAGTMKQSGFLRCQVSAKYNGKEYKGLATVGVEPEKIFPVTQLPDDFLEFWEKEKQEVAKVPLDVRMTLVPERCTSELNVYHVSIQNLGVGSRIYGMLSVPKAEGKYPAILKVPGAGVRGYNGDTENASKGYIVFEIGIHGIPVNLEGSVYWNLYEGALKQYYNINLDSRENYYYKRVYLGCVRAIDFINTLSQFDGKDIIAYGGSQGGALSIVTAALDQRVTGLVSFYPALCDMVGFLHGRAGGWPRMFQNKEFDRPEKIRTAQYYDVVNFARHINVPGYYAFGYNDMVCPPTSISAALNVIEAPMKRVVTENTAHYVYPEQRKESWNWVDDFLNKK